jgi:hypothetical protein
MYSHIFVVPSTVTICAQTFTEHIPIVFVMCDGCSPHAHPRAGYMYCADHRSTQNYLNFTLRLQTDIFATETSWDVRESVACELPPTVFFNVDSGGYTAEGLFVESVIVSAGSIFSMSDSFGDGTQDFDLFIDEWCGAEAPPGWDFTPIPRQIMFDGNGRFGSFVEVILPGTPFCTRINTTVSTTAPTTVRCATLPRCHAATKQWSGTLAALALVVF